MNYQEVNNILTLSAGDLAYSNTYIHGVLPDLNKEKLLTYPLIYTTPFSEQGGTFNNNNVVKTFTVAGFVLGKDAVNLDNSMWKDLVYEADVVLMDWLNAIYNRSKDETEMYIDSFNASPIIKDTTKILSGMSFTITISTQTTFNFCV